MEVKPSPEHPAPEPVPEKVNHLLAKKKFNVPVVILIIVAAIVLALVGAIIFLMVKNTNPSEQQPITTNPQVTSAPNTAKWKTYANTKYNYTVDYPGDWSVSESGSQNGAGFNPSNKPVNPDESDAISISVGQTLGNYANSTLEEYAKIAGKEIQNYDKLASIKKITTASGTVGYETTWMVQPITVVGRPPEGKESESLPITYFELPGNKTSLVRVTLDRKEDLATYEKMLTTVKVMAPLTPIPTVDEKSVLKYVIKKYIVLKHGGDENSLNITVSKIEGNYAQGGASDQGGGGMWFAAKVDGSWLLVWDGNGTIDCASFSLYPNFPTSMVPECYDPATQTMVKR